MFIEIFAFLLSLVFLFYTYLKWNFDYWKKKGVPGPEPRVLFGNIPSFINQKQSIAIDMEDVYKQYKGKYNFAGIFVTRNPVLMVLEPAVTKNILISQFKHFQKNELGDMVDKKVDPIFGNNPFVLSGEAWKEKRAEITPALTSNRLKAMYPLIEDVGKDMVEYIRGKTASIESKNLAGLFTIDVVSKVGFGINAESFKNPKAKVREMGTALISQTIMLIFYTFTAEIFPFVKKIVKLPFVPKHVEVFFSNLMDDTIKYRKKNKVEQNDFLNYIMELDKKKGLTHIEMVSHSLTFFFDGSETSGGAMAYLIYELAKHPEIQKKLREEIKETESSSGLNYDSVSEMPYLDHVFNENQRKNPTAFFISKICTETCQLPLRKDDDKAMVTVEKGTKVWIPIYAIHRHPDNYENPDIFDPERFSPEKGGAKAFQNEGKFLPFGDGPRICIGMKFATLQVKVGIVEIIKNFELSVNSKTIEPIIMDPQNFLNTAKGGFWIDFKAI